MTDIFHILYMLLIKSHRLYEPLLFCPGICVVHCASLARRAPALLFTESLTELHGNNAVGAQWPLFSWCIRCVLVISFLFVSCESWETIDKSADMILLTSGRQCSAHLAKKPFPHIPQLITQGAYKDENSGAGQLLWGLHTEDAGKLLATVFSESLLSLVRGASSLP